MTAVRMVIPVVMIGDVVCTALIALCSLAQTKQVALAVVPEMVVSECDIV